MRRWIPQPSIGRWIGLVALIVVLAAAAWLGVGLGFRLASSPDQWLVNLWLYWQIVGLLGLLLLAGLLLYRVAGAFTLAYEMDRNGFYIIWMGNRVVVPLSQIESLDLGASGARLPWWLLQDIGYYRGQGQTAAGKKLQLFATRPLQHCLVLHTANESYAISPMDQDTFVQDLEQRRKLGAIKLLVPALEHGRIFLYAFWNDRLVRLAIMLAFALNLLLLGVLAARYPQLGATVELRFNAAGQAELRPRHQVLFLPMAAFVLSLLNMGLGLSIYIREQAGARLLQFTSVLVQILFGIALLTIIVR